MHNTKRYSAFFSGLQDTTRSHQQSHLRTWAGLMKPLGSEQGEHLRKLQRSAKIDPTLPTLARTCPKLLKTPKTFQKLPKTSKNFQGFLTEHSKNFQKLPKTSENFQKLPIWIAFFSFSDPYPGKEMLPVFFPSFFQGLFQRGFPSAPLRLRRILGCAGNLKPNAFNSTAAVLQSSRS